MRAERIYMNIQRVIAGVMEKDGLYLIAQRSKKDAHYKLWEFPGGKVEQGETDQECLVRELNEEFGIDTEIGDFLCQSSFVSGDKHIALVAYKVKSFSGDFCLRVHEAVAWVPKEELNTYVFPHPDKTIITTILEQM